MKMTPLRSPKDPIYFCLLLALKWMKDESSGGRKERKIELRLKVLEERMVDENMMNTTLSNQGKDFHFNENNISLFSHIHFFYRVYMFRGSDEYVGGIASQEEMRLWQLWQLFAVCTHASSLFLIL